MFIKTYYNFWHQRKIYISTKAPPIKRKNVQNKERKKLRKIKKG